MSLEAIDHVDLVVSSPERSVPFYEALQRPLGYVESGEIVGERGERVVYISRYDPDGSVGLRERRSDAGPPAADRYAIGHRLEERDLVARVAALEAHL